MQPTEAGSLTEGPATGIATETPHEENMQAWRHPHQPQDRSKPTGRNCSRADGWLLKRREKQVDQTGEGRKRANMHWDRQKRCAAGGWDTVPSGLGNRWYQILLPARFLYSALFSICFLLRWNFPLLSAPSSLQHMNGLQKPSRAGPICSQVWGFSSSTLKDVMEHCAIGREKETAAF